MTEASELPLLLHESAYKVTELKGEVQSVIAQRDYRRAVVLERRLHKAAVEHGRLQKEQERLQLCAHLREMEASRESERGTLLTFVNQRLTTIRRYFSKTYDELQLRHRLTVEDLQDRFTGVIYTAIKLSPTVRSLQRAEAFFAKNSDYTAAEQIRHQIQRQTRDEVVSFESTTRATIDAKLRDAIAAHEAEQQAFAQRLQNEKAELKREADRRISTIANKYRKLYHRLSGKVEPVADPEAGFRVQVHEHIDRILGEFITELQCRPADAGGPIPVEEPRPRPLSSRRGSVRSTRVKRPRNPRVDIALAHAHPAADWTKAL